MKKKNLNLKKLEIRKEKLSDLSKMSIVGGETVTFCGWSCPAQCQPTLADTCQSCNGQCESINVCTPTVNLNSTCPKC